MFNKICKAFEMYVDNKFDDIRDRRTYKNPKFDRHFEQLKTSKIFNFGSSYTECITKILHIMKDQIANSEIALGLLEEPIPFDEGTFFEFGDCGVLIYRVQNLSSSAIEVLNKNNIDPLKCMNFVIGEQLNQESVDKCVITCGFFSYSQDTIELISAVESISITHFDEGPNKKNYLVINDVDHDKESSEAATSMVERTQKFFELINVTLKYIHQPKKFIFEENNVKSFRDPLTSKKIPRLHERPSYTILDPDQIRKIMKTHSITGRVVSGHDRRRHPRKLHSDRYVNKKGETIWIESVWVGPSTTQIGNKQYRVILDK